MEAVTISEEYREEMKALHAKHEDYGVAHKQYAPLVNKLIDQTGMEEILDYGSGKGGLLNHLQVGHDLAYFQYEPANPDFSNPPLPNQFVVCIDVLEHVREENLEAVLADLKRVTLSLGLFTIHHGPAVKILSTGENAHVNQKPPVYWFEKLTRFFNVVQFVKTGTQASYFVVGPLHE